MGADGAGLFGRFADVTGRPQELGVGVTNIGRADETSPNLKDQGAARQGVINHRTGVRRRFLGIERPT